MCLQIFWQPGWTTFVAAPQAESSTAGQSWIRFVPYSIYTLEPLLIATITGPALSDDTTQSMAVVLQTLVALLPGANDAHVVWSHVKSWANDPWTRGAFSYYKGKQMNKGVWRCVATCHAD